MEKLIKAFEDCGLSFDPETWIGVPETDITFKSVLDCPGVYMIVNKDDGLGPIFYIGRSQSLGGRLQGHPQVLTLRKLFFNIQVFVCYTKKGQHYIVENYLLGKLKTVLNDPKANG